MFKKKYTQEEIAELHGWFVRHAAELPETLQLNAATRYMRLKETVAELFGVYKLHGDNPTFAGQIYQLFLIRERLEADGIKD